MNTLKRLIRRMIKISSIIVLTVILLIIVANQIIESSTKNLVYNDIENVPTNNVGLLLGTSKLLKNGRNNLYFDYRINAAAALFHKGKINFILISGDNGFLNYNEPLDMKNELIKKGVPEDKIFLDYAGFRTLDSVVRAKLIFGLDSFIVISQEFHNKRAIYIAGQYGIKAIGFNANDVNVKFGFKTKTREKISRLKVFIDMLFKIKPKYLGETVEIK